MAVAGDSQAGVSRHQQLIESIAQEHRAPVEYVRELFEEEHAKLQASARVKNFVSVIATRLVRNTLHAERFSTNR